MLGQSSGEFGLECREVLGLGLCRIWTQDLEESIM